MERLTHTLRTIQAASGVRLAAWMTGERASKIRPVKAMGLDFPNPLGLAAGFDRTGHLVPRLTTLGFGHVEVGTVTPRGPGTLARRSAVSGARMGINIGSPRHGLDSRVIEDYAAALSRVWERADYVVANLSSPFLERNADTAGVDALIHRLSEERNSRFAQTGRHVALLVKVEGGRRGAPLPAAIASARSHGLDGIVLVSSCIRRIAAVCEYLEGAAVISVGGVATAEDVKARIAAGAALVQIYAAFVRGGPMSARCILAGLEAADRSGQ